jgi:hypothetical protein
MLCGLTVLNPQTPTRDSLPWANTAFAAPHIRIRTRQNRYTSVIACVADADSVGLHCSTALCRDHLDWIVRTWQPSYTLREW